MRQFLVSLLALLAVVCPCARAEQTASSGYVTAIASAAEFELNGMPVKVTPATVFAIKQPNSTLKLSTQPLLYLGEFLEVTGDAAHKTGQIDANRIDLVPSGSTRAEGVGIIDQIPVMTDPAGTILRADGYLLLLPSTLPASFTAPLHTVSDIRTNQWIRYSGTQRADGIVVLDHAELSPNTVNRREDHLRVDHDYDPAAIDQGDAQSSASRLFLGKDPARLPAWHDAAMQARVERIGNSLIPAFQKALPEDDPTRIDFRFQVTDERKHNDAWTFPSGIVLVPHQVVERLPNDSQLAAILADSIAEILEKQDLRNIPTVHKMTAGSVAGDAAGFFIPGANLVPLLANHELAKSMLHHSQQQSGRVGLCLMHDAGYDIIQAPQAWWMLASKPDSNERPRRMPDHTLFLYQDLGTNWHTAEAQGLVSQPATR